MMVACVVHSYFIKKLILLAQHLLKRKSDGHLDAIYLCFSDSFVITHESVYISKEFFSKDDNS